MSAPQTYSLSDLVAQSGFDKRTISYYVQEGLLPKVGRRGRKTRYPQEVLERLLFIRRVRDLQDAGRLRAVTLREIRDVLRGLSPGEIRSGSQAGSGSEPGSAAEIPEDWIRSLFVEPDWDTASMAIPAEEVAADEGGSLQHLVARTEFDAPTEVAPRLQRRGAAGARFPAPESAVLESTDLDPDDLESADLDWEEDDSDLFHDTMAAPEDADSLDATVESEMQLRDLLRVIEARAGAGPDEGTSLERWIRVPVTDAITLSVRNIGEEDAGLVEQLADLLRRMGRG